MANAIKIKGGLEADRLNHTPAERELIVTTDKKKLFIGDGVTPGGSVIHVGDSSDGGGSSVFNYVKCSSAGTSNSTSIVKLPLTEVSSGADFSVANDAITVNESGVFALSATVQVKSSAQRLQATAKIYINGVYDGIERGGSYMRNSGISYDLWSMTFSTLYDLSANDTIEIYVDNVQGASYGGTNAIAFSVNNAGNEIIVERRS